MPTVWWAAACLTATPNSVWSGYPAPADHRKLRRSRVADGQYGHGANTPVWTKGAAVTRDLASGHRLSGPPHLRGTNSGATQSPRMTEIGSNSLSTSTEIMQRSFPFQGTWVTSGRTTGAVGGSYYVRAHDAPECLRHRGRWKPTPATTTQSIKTHSTPFAARSDERSVQHFERSPFGKHIPLRVTSCWILNCERRPIIRPRIQVKDELITQKPELQTIIEDLKWITGSLTQTVSKNFPQR